MVEKTALNKHGLLLLAAMMFTLGTSGAGLAQDKNLEKSFANVVMLEGKLQGASGVTTTFGAGIVVGARANRIYIATANHVVRSGRTPATDITVRFRFLPGEKFSARLLDNKDADLDLAVLSITDANGEIPSSEFDYTILGKTDALDRGGDVHPLGNPRGQAWGVAINPEKVDRKKANEITFQSSYIQPGHSGGALLNGCGDIVGLIVRDQPPNGEAVRIEQVLQALRAWNYPVDLKAGAGCSPAASSQASSARQGTATSAAVTGKMVDNNQATPATLAQGTSPTFSLSRPQAIGYFLFTPQATSTYRIAALSQPAHVDIGWGIAADTGFSQMLVQCDNDQPSRGDESCPVFLNGGQTYYVLAQNLTGDQPGEPEEAVNFSFTITPDSGTVPGPATSGAIYIRYTGDMGGCAVNLAIELEQNARIISPTGNFFSVENLALGEDYYTIVGTIQCSVWGTNCTAVGEGAIVLQNELTYDIRWQDLQTGYCAVSLDNLLP